MIRNKMGRTACQCQIAPRARRVTAVLLLALAAHTHAASLQIQVQDAAGNALSDAAVYAVPEGTATAVKPGTVVQIEQAGRKYLPLVTVMQTGTSVSFPNNDTVRHHVYSFSAPKKFEMKLYSGVPSDTVLFDKAGTVVLGCNIHDKMIAYIHVVDTPFFARSDSSGKAKIDSLPKGKYKLKVWHYLLPANSPPAEQVLSLAKEDLPVTVKLAVKNAAGAANTTSPANPGTANPNSNSNPNEPLGQFIY